MSRARIFAWGPLTWMLAALSQVAIPAGAQVSSLGDNYSDRFNRQASGVYLVQGQPTSPPEAPPYFLLFNVYREGLFSTSAQVQGTTLSGTAFTDDQGIWKQTGPLKIRARLLSFNFLPPGSESGSGSQGGPTGLPHSNAVADVLIDFDEDFQNFSATFSVTVYPPNVNPISPEAVPLGPPTVIPFEGQRLTVPD
ncbi:MAG: hypothetical protein GY722_10400 [bacterium]|nr:hypothetical protein [bacterium]